MRALLVFLWTDGRREELEASEDVSDAEHMRRNRVMHDGAWFGLRDWGLLYANGTRVMQLVYAQSTVVPR